MGPTPARLGRLFVPRDRVLLLLRAAETLERGGLPLGHRLGVVVRYRLAQRWGVYVHQSARIGNVYFAHPTSVVIGAGVVVEDDVTIFQGVTLGAVDHDQTDYPLVRRGATLYAGATVLGGVEIGSGAVVGAHSLVLHDVPAGATVVGAPARIVGSTHRG